MQIESLLPVLQVLAAIAGLIFIHEFGHFFVARLLGVEVEEFGIGLPPRALTLFHAWGTRFSLNLLPIGGFVRPKGENDPGVPGGLAAASPWVRIAVISAGPLFNLLAAVILFAVIFLKFGLPVQGPLKVVDVSNGITASEAGLVGGDLISAVNGIEVTSETGLSAGLEAAGSEDISLTIIRSGTQRQLVIPGREMENGVIDLGVILEGTFNSRSVSPINAMLLGVLGTGAQIQTLATLPAKVFEGSIAPEEARMVGYRGMVDIYQDMRVNEARAGIPANVVFLFFTASISVSLAILNLLPIPALDGGRILMTLPEIVFRRRIPRRYQAILTTGSMAALIFLMLYINLQDFINPVQLH